MLYPFIVKFCAIPGRDWFNFFKKILPFCGGCGGGHVCGQYDLLLLGGFEYLLLTNVGTLHRRLIAATCVRSPVMQKDFYRAAVVGISVASKTTRSGFESSHRQFW